MKCKLCGKANQTATKNKAHSWVHSQHCGRCHYLGQRTAYSNFGNQYNNWKKRKEKNGNGL